jgi:dihydroorotate dehydrogenase
MWRLTRPFLFMLNAERAHRLVMSTLSAAPRLHGFFIRILVGPPRRFSPIMVGGLRLAGPVGLAAGLDKDGEAVSFWPALGFGFIEMGTVTCHAQEGNPGPRLFRLKPEGALINRMGFNNEGAAALAERLAAIRAAGRWPNIPVGANIGKSKITPLENAIDDYLESVRVLAPVVDYFTVNVSSPNTPGLRKLQEAEPLHALLSAVVAAAKELPVLVKFSPDLDDSALSGAVKVAITSGCSGIIATNTTCSRPLTTGRLDETGGMSGAPLWPLSRARLQLILDEANGAIPVIGAGGIRTAAQAQELLDAGCAAVQLYTGLIFEGPGLIHQINDGLKPTE